MFRELNEKIYKEMIKAKSLRELAKDVDYVKAEQLNMNRQEQDEKVIFLKGLKEAIIKEERANYERNKVQKNG